MRTNNAQCVTAGNMVGDVFSNAIYLDQIFSASIQAYWTGTPTGTLEIQVSNDMGPDLNGNGAVVHWTGITGSQVALAGVAGSFFWNLDDLAARWMRLAYAHTSGTGTLNARQTLKGF